MQYTKMRYSLINIYTVYNILLIIKTVVLLFIQKMPQIITEVISKNTIF